MTTVFLTEKQCYACGSKSQYPLVDLTLSIIGPRDLDGRPSLIQRSSVYLWIQRCFECGYCAPEISQGTAEEIRIIEKSEYQLQLNDKEYPDTANSFLCHSIIMEQTNLFADSGWAAVFAAWICDDNGYSQSAIECREKALNLFSKAKEQGQGFGESPAEEQLYLADLHRRSGHFEQAALICELQLQQSHPERIFDLFCLEKKLIDKKDSGCHNDSEIDELNIDAFQDSSTL